MITQGERIREIRKSLSLTMEQFGEKIGVTKSTISNIENGNRNATEHMIKSICREYGVDYIWLTTGEGEMFIDTDDDFMERIDRIMAGEDEARKNLFKFMLDLSDGDIAALSRLMGQVADYMNDLRCEHDEKKADGS
jgi:transcriptional regulator with XRE-family HTH domain